MSAPLEHVERPRPPWRKESKTECGREVAEFARVLSRDELEAKIKAQGIQRAALSTCMTCLETARRHGDWAHDPVGVTFRQNGWRTPELLPVEIRALSLLYEAHREEFDEIVESLTSMQSIDDLRAARRKRRGA